MPYGLYAANPSVVRQAPDNKAILHSTQLSIPDFPLATPFMAQQYFEPGINTKLNRRTKPKVDFTLPSDMPRYPLGFVPTNQTPGENGAEAPLIVQKEAVPADLIDMFTKISAQQAAESKAVEEANVLGRMDIGSLVSREYQQAMTEKQTDARVENLVKQGYNGEEISTAMNAARMERAVSAAKTVVPSASVSIEAALRDKFPSKKMMAKEEKEEAGTQFKIPQFFAMKKDLSS